MPFDGAGGYIGSSRTASANTNKILSINSEAPQFTPAQDAINTDGLCAMSISITQVAGVAGTGGVRLQIIPRGDAVTYPTPATVVPLGLPTLVEFPRVASRAVQVEATGSGVAGTPNIYRILFMACV